MQRDEMFRLNSKLPFPLRRPLQRWRLAQAPVSGAFLGRGIARADAALGDEGWEREKCVPRARQRERGLVFRRKV